MADLMAVADDGARLAVNVVGDGSPILLIPGLGSSAHAFVHLAELLRPHHTVITYDPRGIGRSELGSAAYAMEQLATDVTAVLQACGIRSSAVLGASMGGMVAQRLAIDHPRVVERLLLAATTCSGRPRVPPERGVRERLMGRGARTPGDAYRLACTVLYSEKFARSHPDFIEAEVEYRTQHPVRGRVFTAQNTASQAHDLCDQLHAIRAPTLVLHGSADALVPLANADYLARQISHAHHYWFDGCGHLFFHEQPELSAEVISSFIHA